MYILLSLAFIWITCLILRLLGRKLRKIIGPPLIAMRLDMLQIPRWRKIKNDGRYWLYLLKCEKKKYYVGISKNLAQRRAEEWSQGERCPKWLKIYRPKRYIGVYRLRTKHKARAEKIETRFTKALWSIYGKNNVRGGRYCSSKRYKSGWSPHSQVHPRHIPNLTHDAFP